MMTFGIADFPSLGFREGVGPSPDKAMDASRTPFGALSNLMSMLGVNAKEVEQPGVCGGDGVGRRGVGGGGQHTVVLLVHGCGCASPW